MSTLAQALMNRIPGNLGDSEYRQFLLGIGRQWLHCGVPCVPWRPWGHRRRQTIVGAGEFFCFTNMIGCSCGKVFWNHKSRHSRNDEATQTN